MKQEYWLAVIIGLVVFAYILDALIAPFTLDFPTPYHYFTFENFMLFPFTYTSIVVKGIAVYAAVPLLLSFSGTSKKLKGVIIFIAGGLLQLYALQAVASNTYTVPLEWALSFTLAGVALMLTSFLYFILGFFQDGTKSSYEGKSFIKKTDSEDNEF